MQRAQLATPEKTTSRPDPTRRSAERSASPVGIADNRPGAAAQRDLSVVAETSPAVMQQKSLLQAASRSPAAMRQRVFSGMVADSPRVLQQKAFADAVQGVQTGIAANESSPEAVAQREPEPNRTGLPDRLKAGVESLSGMSLDGVKVHYNSSQPEQLNAMAYAQGSDIHVGPGQERHLPHEAWHVAQQAQGRVQPTMQMKPGVPVNDDKGLEREADAMGARAASGMARALRPGASPAPPRRATSPVQMAGPYKGLMPDHDAVGGSYMTGGAKSADFTYHHIIPENKLLLAIQKIHDIQAAVSDQEHPDHQRGETLKGSIGVLTAAAESQWLATRVKNTTYAINSEFRDFEITVSEGEIRPILAAAMVNPDLNTAFAAVEALIKAKIKILFDAQRVKLEKRISAMLGDQQFLANWKQRNITAQVTAALLPLRASNAPLFDPVAIEAAILRIPPEKAVGEGKGTNRARVLEMIKADFQTRGFQPWYVANCLPLYATAITGSATLKKIVRDEGLPTDKDDAQKAHDAMVWLPGNIHRGPKSGLRLTKQADDAISQLVDDGGEEFEIAAVNLVSTGHYQQLETLNGHIDDLIGASMEPLASATVTLANTVVLEMQAIQALATTPFQASQWQEETVGDQQKMRLVRNDAKIVAAGAASDTVARLGTQAGIPGVRNVV